MAVRIRRVTSPNAPAKTYLYAEGGRAYRVYDRCFGPPHAKPGRYRTCPNLGDPRAAVRWFVSPSGGARCYKFERDEPRTPTLYALERQLRSAEYPGRQRLMYDGPAPAVDPAFHKLLADSRRNDAANRSR